MQGVFDFLNQGWVGSLVGIIGVIVGLFLYKRSTRTATPAYQKSSLRLLGQNEDILPEEVTVFFKDEEIARLTSVSQKTPVPGGDLRQFVAS